MSIPIIEWPVVIAPTGGGKTLVVSGASIYENATDQFKGGTVQLLDASKNALGNPVSVVGNTTDANPSIHLAAPAPANVAFIRDLNDDDIAHNVTAADMLPSYNTITDQLKIANISVKQDPSPATIPFSLYAEGDEGNIEIDGSPNPNLANEDFWAAHVLGGFQGSIRNSNDPEGGTTAALLGATVPTNNPKDYITYIYRETIRDAYLNRTANEYAKFTNDAEIADIVLAHEIGHLLGLEHDPAHGNIMLNNQVKAAPPRNIGFSGEGLRIIITNQYPGGKGL